MFLWCFGHVLMVSWLSYGGGCVGGVSVMFVVRFHSHVLVVFSCFGGLVFMFSLCLGHVFGDVSVLFWWCLGHVLVVMF